MVEMPLSSIIPSLILKELGAEHIFQYEFLEGPYALFRARMGVPPTPSTMIYLVTIMS